MLLSITFNVNYNQMRVIKNTAGMITLDASSLAEKSPSIKKLQNGLPTVLIFILESLAKIEIGV